MKLNKAPWQRYPLSAPEVEFLVRVGGSLSLAQIRATISRW